MIQTATLSPAITASPGPALIQAGAQVTVAANDFARSFAKASEAPVPGVIPGAPSSPAVDMPVAPVTPIPAALPAPTIAQTAAAQTAAAVTTRQEWAATGKGLPMPVVAGSSAWPEALTPRLPDAESDPSPAVPAEAVLVAGYAAPATARPGAMVTRPAPGARPRPATGSDQEVDPDDAGDTGEPTTAGEDASVPPPVGVPRAIDGVPAVPVALPVKAAVRDANATRSDVAMPDGEVAAPTPQVATRARAGRRDRPAAPASSVEPAPTTAAPAASQTAVTPAAITPAPATSPTSAVVTTAISADFLQGTSVDTAPAVPSATRALPRLAAERGTVLLDGAASVPANRFAPRPSAAPQSLAETAPDEAPDRMTVQADTRAMPTIPVAIKTPAIVAPVFADAGVGRPKGSSAGVTMPTRQDGVQPAPALVSTPLVPDSLGDGPKQALLPAAATPPAATAPSPLRERTDGPASIPSIALAATPSGLTSPASMTPAPVTPSIRPTMLATAARDVLGAAVLPADAQMVPRGTGVVATRGITQSESVQVVAPRLIGAEATAPVALASPLAPVQPTTVTTMPALMTPIVSTGLMPAPALTGIADAVSTPAPALRGTPRWTATGATTPVALAVAQPEAIQPQPGTVASAAQVFGAAIQAATRTRDAKTADGSDPASLSATAALAQPIAATAAQQAPLDMQQASLDMRQERWPHAMIERIETIRDAARDAANATDTRIRLIPDALGAIDVSVKTAGDTVHVHFAAEQAATRTLLADAQPRLAELAEARGLKLGQAAVGDGNGGGNAGTSQQRAPAPPQISNRTTASSITTTAAATDDIRIA